MHPAIALSAGLLLILGGAAGVWSLRRLLRQAASDRRYREAGQARERAWEELLLSLHLQTMALDNLGLGIAHIKDRTIQWANPRWATLFGARPEHLAGAAIRPFHLDQATFEAFGRTAYAELEREGRFSGEIRFRRVDGSLFWALAVGSLLVPGRPEDGALWCLEDITARVEAQQERDDILKLNQKLIAAAPTGIVLYRAADGGCILVNEAAARIVGARPEDLIRQNFRHLPTWADSGLLAAAEAALASGTEQVLEIAGTSSFGREAAMSCTFVPFESRGERLLLFMLTDIMVRRRAERERERLMGELEQKNKELETLVHVASHDLRSPLVNIQGFSQRLEKSLDELERQILDGDAPESLRLAVRPLLCERMPAALEFIRASGAKMDAIINGLLRLSRAGRMVLRTEPLDMDRILATAAAALAFQLQEAEGTLDLQRLPSCKADPVQVAQIFSNLLDNAIKYRQPGQPLRIRVHGRAGGARIVYCVEDNGAGIALEHRERIFDIFQRLDPLGATPGEGLGLTLVRRMVERNDGRIWVESAPGQGSRFWVELPAL